MSIIQSIRQSVGLEPKAIKLSANDSNSNATPKTKRPINWKSKSVFQTRKDIKAWKKAKQMAQSAEFPNNSYLQTLYTDIADDGMLDSQMGNRIGQLMTMPFVLKNTKGDIDEEQTKALKESPFFRFLTLQGLHSVYYGYSLVQFLNDEKGNLTAELLPRTNTVPQTGTFYEDLNETKGIKYREMPEFGTWILEYNSGGIGLIDKVTPPVIFSRFATACWSELCEIYGIPPRVMKTNTTDQTQMARAEQMMKDMGSAAWFIIDEDEEFSFADNVNTKGEVYEGLIRTCDNRICLIISGSVIGQDTKNGNKGKEQVAEDILWYRIQDDMELITQQWNNINLPALVKHGIVKDGLKFNFQPAEDVEQLWKFASEAMKYYDLDVQWLKDKFGIEILDKKQAQQNQNADQKSALSFFLKASNQGAIQTCCGQAHTLSVNLSGKLNNEKLIEDFYKAKGSKTFDDNLFNFTAQNLTEAFSKGIKSGKISPFQRERGLGGEVDLSANIGITYGIDDPMALTAYEMNIFRFAGAKTIAESQLLNKAFRDSKSFEDFRIRASLIGKIYNEEWLRTEYNTALTTGETSATYHRLRNQLKLYPYWLYRTVGDDKVRDEHDKLDGLLLSAESPIWSKIYPPNGWNCRCFVLPRLKSEKGDADLEENEKIAIAYTHTDDFKKAEKSGWGINRAETQEVFTENQQYISKATEIDKLLSNLGPGDYTIKEPKVNIEISEYNDSLEDYWKANAQDDKLILFDYNKRPISTTKLDFTKAIDDSKLLAEINNIIENPDQVWLKSDKKGNPFNQFLYIKNYKDSNPIAFIAELKKGNLVIKSLLKIKDLALQWGLLIKN
jgi:SPP1 gp7 family putative phage head morphogenesis protein